MARLGALGNGAAVPKIPRERAVRVGALVHQRQGERCARRSRRQEIRRHLRVDRVVDERLRLATVVGGGGLDQFHHDGFVREVGEDVGGARVRLGSFAFSPIQGHLVRVHAAVVQVDFRACASGHFGQFKVGHRQVVDRGLHRGVGRASVRRGDVEVKRQGLVRAFEADERALQRSAFKGFATINGPRDAVVGRPFVPLGHQVRLPWRARFELANGVGHHFRVHFHRDGVGIGASAFGLDRQRHGTSGQFKSAQLKRVFVRGSVQSFRR